MSTSFPGPQGLVDVALMYCVNSVGAPDRKMVLTLKVNETGVCAIRRGWGTLGGCAIERVCHWEGVPLGGGGGHWEGVYHCEGVPLGGCAIGRVCHWEGVPLGGCAIGRVCHWEEEIDILYETWRADTTYALPSIYASHV